MTPHKTTGRKAAFHAQQAKPEALPVEPANIPAELKTLPQWLAWDYVRKNDKWDKLPFNAATGEPAKTNDPATWSTFDQAHAYYRRTGCAGIGFVFAAADPFAGVDLDDCRDPETGVVEPWADAITKRIASYAEVSPSETGVKIFCRARLGRSVKRDNVELYDRVRFFAVTGRPVAPLTIADAQLPLDALAAELQPAQQPAAAATPTATFEDDDRRKAIEALNHLSPSRCVDYQSWLEVGMALHSVGDDLLPEWDAWSRGCPEKYSPAACAAKWQTFRRDGAITLGSLLHWAREDTGWYPERQTAARAPNPAPVTRRALASPTVEPATAPRRLTLDAAARIGLAGEFVRVVEPHSEADPAALLIQFLAAFGACIGRNAHFNVESTTHYLTLFVALVGLSGKGRKGTSWDHVDRLFAGVEPRWDAICCSGLSSAEGLLWHLRDEGNTTDKRLICCESEFAAVLINMDRKGNTLSPLLRSLWDGKRVARTLTKNDPITATGAHVSIIAHVTEAEITRRLCETEQANGFGNRFLWIAVQRSKLLPEGGQPPDAALRDLREELRPALAFAQAQQAVDFDPGARAQWHRIYGELSEARPGLPGSLMARAEAQVRRLACLYALLDQSPVVRPEHLDAALAVWRYAEQSVGQVFGHSLGSPVADQLLAALEGSPDGMTRTDIHNGLFDRHVNAKQLNAAFALLESSNCAHCVRTATAGRPEERWFASPRPAKEANKAEQPATVCTLSPLTSLHSPIPAPLPCD